MKEIKYQQKYVRELVDKTIDLLRLTGHRKTLIFKVQIGARGWENKCILLKILYNLVNIFFRYILDFLLVVNGKKVDTSVCGFNNDVQRDNPKSTSLATAFALNPKANLTLSATKRYSNIRIGLQFVLKCIDVIRKRAIAFGQSLRLSKKFFRIVESHHSLLSFCPKLINQVVKRSKSLASEITFLHFTIASGNGLCYKSLLCLNIRFGSNQFINGYSLDCSQYLFQTWNETGIFNIQYNLSHITS